MASTMSTKCMQSTAVLFCLIQLGFSITCKMGGTAPGGSTIPSGTMDCSQNMPGVTFLNKCYVSRVKNGTQTYISRGCVPQPAESQTCGIDMKVGDLSIKGCCCETELCNDDAFRDKCLNTSTVATTKATTTTNTTTPTTTTITSTPPSSTTTTATTKKKNNNDINSSAQQTGSVLLTLFFAAVAKGIF